MLASLFDAPVAAVRVVSLEGSEPYECEILNLQRVLSVADIPAALAALQSPVVFTSATSPASTFLDQLTQDNRWPGKTAQGK